MRVSVSVREYLCAATSVASLAGRVMRALAVNIIVKYTQNRRAQNTAVPVGADVNKSLIKINNNRLTNCEKSISKSPRKANAFKKHKKRVQTKLKQTPKIMSELLSD